MSVKFIRSIPGDPACTEEPALDGWSWLVWNNCKYIGHLIGPDHPKSFDDVVKAHRIYAETSGQPERALVDILSDLTALVRCGLVTVVEEDNVN